MAFTPRTRAQIRQSLLDDLTTRYAALNPAVRVNTVPGSDAYIKADAVTLELEQLEAQALALTKDILPDQADTDYLNRHGLVDGVTRNPAVPWSGKVTITGTPSATVTFGTSVLAYRGVNYGSFADASTGSPISSIGLSVGGTADVRVTAAVAGSATQLADSTILTWSTTPANANSTATVKTNGTLVNGADAESDPDYAARIISRRQNRPASGNRADWRAWALAYAGIADAYVYPNYYQPSSATGVPGAVTVVALGPVPGDSPSNTRFISGATATKIGQYIEGQVDSAGISPAAGTVFPQLRPVTMINGDYTITPATQVLFDVELQISMAGAYAFPWIYVNTYLILGGPTATSFSIAGNHASQFTSGGSFLPVLIKVKNGSTSVVRGNYVMVQPTNVVNSGGNTIFTIPDITASTSTPPINGSCLPIAGTKIAPAPPNWALIRTALFEYLDQLGPGDTSPACRWPTEDVRGRSTLYQSALAGALIQQLDSNGALVSGVRGVLGVTCVSPAVDSTPNALEIYDMRDLLIHQ
jgi:uncharacterized phage protein gp47/JayE